MQMGYSVRIFIAQSYQVLLTRRDENGIAHLTRIIHGNYKNL